MVRPLLEMLNNITGMESTYLTTIELDKGKQTVKYARNIGTLAIPEGFDVSWADSLCKRSIESCVTTTSDVENLWGDSKAAKKLGICSYMSTPIVFSDGRLMGTLCAASSVKIQQPQKANTILELFGSIVSNFLEREILISELSESNKTLQRIALTDPLNFKSINDQYGHHIGDLFLKEITTRLSDCLRATDVLGRLGGDEFLYIGFGSNWNDIENGQSAAAHMQTRLTKATQGVFQLEEISLTYTGASAAVIVQGPETTTCEKAIQAADDAMYQIKLQRKAESSQ
nr:diguanylate cyclase [Undibacterium sp. CY21W]